MVISKIKLLFLSVFIFICVDVSLSQTTIGQLLASEQNGSYDIVSKNYLDITQSFPNRWNWVDKFDIRTEYDRLQSGRQQFLLRTNFNSFFRKKHEKTKFNAITSKKMADITLLKYEYLYEKYTRIISLLKKQADTQIKSTQIQLFKSVDSLYYKQLSAGEKIDLADYIKNREKVTTLEKENLESKLFIQDELNRFKVSTSDSIIIRNLISAKNMSNTVSNLIINEIDHPEISRENFDINLYNSELQIEKAKNNKILDFTQLEYTRRSDLLLENRFSIGVGLSIPWYGSSSYRYQSILYKQADAKFEHQLTKLELNRKLEDKRAEFEKNYQIYLLYNNQNELTSWADMKSKIEKSGRLDPIEILLIKQYEIDNKEKIHDLYYTLLYLYIESIYLSGKLSSDFNILEQN